LLFLKPFFLRGFYFMRLKSKILFSILSYSSMYATTPTFWDGNGNQITNFPTVDYVRDDFSKNPNVTYGAVKHDGENTTLHRFSKKKNGQYIVTDNYNQIKLSEDVTSIDVTPNKMLKVATDAGENFIFDFNKKLNDFNKTLDNSNSVMITAADIYLHFSGSFPKNGVVFYNFPTGSLKKADETNILPNTYVNTVTDFPLTYTNEKGSEIGVGTSTNSAPIGKIKILTKKENDALPENLFKKINEQIEAVKAASLTFEDRIVIYKENLTNGKDTHESIAKTLSDKILTVTKTNAKVIETLDILSAFSLDDARKILSFIPSEKAAVILTADPDDTNFTNLANEEWKGSNNGKFMTGTGSDTVDPYLNTGLNAEQIEQLISQNDSEWIAKVLNYIETQNPSGNLSYAIIQHMSSENAQNVIEKLAKLPKFLDIILNK